MALTDLAVVLRAAGLTVIEEPGWQTRWRGGGDYRAGRPTAVMLHHTASATSAANDVAYMTYNSSIAPIANLYVARNGEVTVMAGGPTNTNGKGRDTWGGGVPDDSMNTHAIGIEIGNNGVGEQYPPAQQQAVADMVPALCAAYGIAHHNVRAHFEWAPDRKIDPSGPSRWAPQGGRWNMEQLRAELGAPVPPPVNPPDQEGASVLVNLIRYHADGYPSPQDAVFAQYSGGYKIWIGTLGALGWLMNTTGLTISDLNDDLWVAAGPVLPGTPLPYDCDAWGRRTF